MSPLKNLHKNLVLSHIIPNFKKLKLKKEVVLKTRVFVKTLVNYGIDYTQERSVLLAPRPQLCDCIAKTTSKIAALLLFRIRLRPRLTVKPGRISRL